KIACSSLRRSPEAKQVPMTHATVTRHADGGRWGWPVPPREMTQPMNPMPRLDAEADPRGSSRLLDVLIRAGLIGALAVLCYQVLSPSLTLLAWSIILAATMSPVHQWLARRIGGKQGLASTVLVLVGVVLIITPTAVLLNSLADSVRHFIGAVHNNT